MRFPCSPETSFCRQRAWQLLNGVHDPVNILLILQIGDIQSLLLQLLHGWILFGGVDLIISRDGAFPGGGGSTRHLSVNRLPAGEESYVSVNLAVDPALFLGPVRVDLLYN